MADGLGASIFPASAGNKLDIQWGVGRELLLADVGSAETEETAFGSAQWQACVTVVIEKSPLECAEQAVL